MTFPFVFGICQWVVDFKKCFNPDEKSTHEPKLVINFESLSGNDDQKMVTALNNARSHVQSTGGLAIIYFPTGACTLTTTVPTVPRDSNIVF